jgi:hypothetical protein
MSFMTLNIYADETGAKVLIVRAGHNPIVHFPVTVHGLLPHLISVWERTGM